MNRWARGTTLATLGVVFLVPIMALPTPASADEGCPVLDPACGRDTVHDLVDGTTDSVDDVVDDVTDIVEEVMDGATGGVEEVIDDTLGIGPTDPGGGDGVGTGGGGPGGGGDGGAGDRGGGTGTDGTGGSGSDPTRRQREGVGSPMVDVPPSLGAPSDAPHLGTRVDKRAVTAERQTLGLAFARTLRGVAVMLVLLGLVAGFVSFQHALDRRDPKLAPATLGSDRVRFS